MTSSINDDDAVLTGIKPTGHPHLGNYVGAIRPALDRATGSARSMFFIADYHALNQMDDPDLYTELCDSVAAAWLACGLDPGRSHFYCQSDIPEVFELATILAAVTPKGWMNKAHAYKAKVEANLEAGEEPDVGVNMGLYTYPILMAADILAFDTAVVPVGADQVQDVEITRDMAARLNAFCGEEVVRLPDYELQARGQAIPGTDGRKMSKSYGNVVPLFAEESEWREAIVGIVTDSTGRYEPKQAEGSTVYELYAALADETDAEALRVDLEEGRIGWGEAKARLLDLVVERLEEPARRYRKLVDSPGQIDEILQAGAERVRPYARKVLARVRQGIGGRRP